LENPQLEPFIEAGERLRAHNELLRDSSKDGVDVDILSEELREIVTSFIKRRSVKTEEKSN
ncbi:hypothetical protein KEJ23_07645, partial [Candidatus Bathyarchaeota archaeon]|nr:hypothetical protein [Candidatus Bathyarchaeota archaeon]